MITLTQHNHHHHRHHHNYNHNHQNHHNHRPPNLQIIIMMSRMTGRSHHAMVAVPKSLLPSCWQRLPYSPTSPKLSSSTSLSAPSLSWSSATIQHTLIILNFTIMNVTHTFTPGRREWIIMLTKVIKYLTFTQMRLHQDQGKCEEKNMKQNVD